MKKIVGIIVAVVLSLFLLWFVGTGFTRINSVYINEYRVSEDGKTMTINIGVASSADHVRKLAVHQQEGEKLYLDCYAAFGGINGTIGSKSDYTLTIDDKTEMIAIYRNANSYEEVLRKDSAGVWQRVCE